MVTGVVASAAAELAEDTLPLRPLSMNRRVSPSERGVPERGDTRAREATLSDQPFPSFRKIPSPARQPFKAAPMIPRDFPTPSPATNRFGTFVSRLLSVAYFVS